MNRLKKLILLFLLMITPLLAILISLRFIENNRIADLEYALENEDPDVRAATAVALAAYGDKAVPVIAKALNDGDKRVRGAAMKALCAIKSGRAADALAGLLSHPDRKIRVRAIALLGRIGRPAKTHLLKALETDPFPMARMFSANSLAAVVEPGDAPAIMERFERQSLATKMHLVIALVNVGDAEADAALGRLLDSEDPRVRLYVINTVAEVPLKTDMPLFIRGMKDESESVRVWAMYGLENLNLPETYPVVVASLEDSVWYIRKEAAFTLGNLGNPEAVPHLIPFLKDPHPLVRGNAAESLGKLGTPDLAPSIKPLLDEESPAVQIRAAEALARLNDFSGMETLIAMLDSPEGLYRMGAHKALRGISKKDFGRDTGKWMSWWKGAEETTRAAADRS